MFDFLKSSLPKITAAFAAVVLLAGCFQDSVSPAPENPAERGEYAGMRIRMRIAPVNALGKGSTISLSKMIVVLTSNSATPTATDTIRDTLRTAGTTPTISPLSTTQQEVKKTYLVKALRSWKIQVFIRDSQDSLIHFDSTSTPPLLIADTAVLNLGLSSRYAMYDAKFESLPDSISSLTGNVKQKLQVNRLVLKIDGEAVRDSSRPGFFSPGGLGHVLSYDYVTTSTRVVMSTGVTSNLNGVFFTSATNGFLVGAGGIVRRTTNGGANWSAPNSTPGTTKTLRSVYFLNATTGWIVGDTVAWRTTNSGADWVAQTSPSPFNTSLKSVHFVNATTGWAISGSIFRSLDGGATWSTIAGVPASNAIRMVNVDTGYSVGANLAGATVRKTVNGSLLSPSTPTWDPQATPTTKALRDVFPVNSSLVYAVGDTGTILRTTNGGTNWVQQTNFVGSGINTRNLKAVYFLDAAVGYVVGDNGTIYATSDSGATWTLQASPTTANLTSIYFSGTKAYVVGDNGTFFTLTGPRLVTMEVYGPMGTWNVANPLYSGSKYVNVAVGVDVTIPLVLKWVGPSNGGGSISATLGRVGKVSIIGKLPGTP